MSARVVAAIAVGSNLGDREKNLDRARVALERAEGVVVLRRSRWHETQPVGGPAGQPAFLNGVLLVETVLEPEELLALLSSLEAKAGRDRAGEERNGPRVLDLDLLFHGDAVRSSPDLTLPHPRMEERRFVLDPLAELLPERVLPGSGTTVRERARELALGGAPGGPVEGTGGQRVVDGEGPCAG